MTYLSFCSEPLFTNTPEPVAISGGGAGALVEVEATSDEKNVSIGG